MSGRTPPRKPSPLHQAILQEVHRQAITGYRLKHMTGLPQTTIHRFLSGESSPTVTTLEAIAGALDLVIEVRNRR